MIYAKLLVKGKVQNVRYRDYVRAIAKLLGLNGAARHSSGGVEIEIEAKDEAELDEFVRLIEKKKDDKFGIDVEKASVVFSKEQESAKFDSFSVE